MRLSLPLLFSIVGLMSCQKKSLPVISERKTEPPKILSVYPPPGTVVPDTLQGKQVFINRCNYCHGLPEPMQFSIAKWEGILELMIPRAGIRQENAVHVRAYVLANAAK